MGFCCIFTASLALGFSLTYMTSFNRNITPVRKTFLSPFPAAETAVRESKSLPQGHTASEHSRWFSACPYSLGMYLSTLASQTSSCQHLRAFFLWLEPLCLLLGQVRSAGQWPSQSSSQPMTVGCWWINTPAPLPPG